MTLDGKIVDAVARAIHASPAFQPTYGPWQDGVQPVVQQHCIIAASAAITAYQAVTGRKDATFEVQQEGMSVALASGPREKAYAEAMHYAAVYGQDGPVEVFEHVPVPLPNPPSDRSGS